MKDYSPTDWDKFVNDTVNSFAGIDSIINSISIQELRALEYKFEVSIFSSRTLILKASLDPNFDRNSRYVNDTELLDKMSESALRLVRARISLLENTKSNSRSKKNENKEMSLRDMFGSTSDFVKGIQVLYTGEAPILGERGNFLVSKNKSIQAITGWFRAARAKGLITNIPSNRDEIANILRSHFKDLEISARSIDNSDSKAHEEYFDYYLVAIK